MDEARHFALAAVFALFLLVAILAASLILGGGEPVTTTTTTTPLSSSTTSTSSTTTTLADSQAVWRAPAPDAAIPTSKVHVEGAAPTSSVVALSTDALSEPVTTEVGPSGTFGFTVTLPPGEHTLLLVTRTPAGSTFEESRSITVLPPLEVDATKIAVLSPPLTATISGVTVPEVVVRASSRFGNVETVSSSDGRFSLSVDVSVVPYGSFLVLDVVDGLGRSVPVTVVNQVPPIVFDQKTASLPKGASSLVLTGSAPAGIELEFVSPYSSNSTKVGADGRFQVTITLDPVPVRDFSIIAASSVLPRTASIRVEVD